MNLADVRIRRAQLVDAPDISVLFKPLVAQYITHEFTPKAEQVLLSSMEPSIISKNLREGHLYWLAEASNGSSNKLAGALGIRAQTHVYHFFVAKSFHQKGIGRLLWQYNLRHNYNSEFTVNASRYAIKFYEKLGFKQSQSATHTNGITCFPMVFRQKNQILY